MVCVCKDALAGLIPKLSPLAGLNVNPSLAAGLGGAAGLGANVSASPNLALAASLGLNVNVSALANLSALASFCANMLSAFGIDMASPGAPLQLKDLFNAIVNNRLSDMLAKLPLGATPQLAALADLGSVAGLGIDPLSPNAAAQLQGQMDLAGNLGLDMAASLGLSPSLAASLAAQANAMLAAQAAANTGLGLNLAGLGLPGLNALGGSLGAIGANINALNPMLPPLALNPKFLQKVKDFFDKLNAANKALNKDLSLPVNWTGLPGSISKSVAPSKSWAPSASAAPSPAASFSAQKAVFESPQFNQMVSGLPAIPSLANLLAMLMNSIFAATGTRVVQHSPCGPLCFLMSMLPPGCLCPKMSSELSLKPSFKFDFKPTASFTPTATATDPKDMFRASTSATDPKDMFHASASATDPDDMVTTSASANTHANADAVATGLTGSSGRPRLGLGGRRMRGLRLGRKGPSRKQRMAAEKEQARAQRSRDAGASRPATASTGPAESDASDTSSDRTPISPRVASPRLRGRRRRDSSEGDAGAPSSSSKPRWRRSLFRVKGKR